MFWAIFIGWAKEVFMKKKKMSKRSLLNEPLVLRELVAGRGEASTLPVSRQVGVAEGKAPV